MATVVLDCAWCTARHVSCGIVAEQAEPNAPGETMPRAFCVLAVCGACNKISMVRLEPSNEARSSHWKPKTFALNVTNNGNFKITDQWPATKKADAPPHTPAEVAQYFGEAVKAANVGAWTAASMVFRKALESATTNLDATLSSKKLVQRIDALEANHKITPDLKAWAHAIRIDGNEAAHEPAPSTQAEAESLQYFTEIFLTYVYTLPGELKLRAPPQSAGAKT